MNYLTEKQLAEFERAWPDAVAYLRRCHIKNELAFLRRKQAERELGVWERKRWAELEELVGKEVVK